MPFICMLSGIRLGLICRFNLVVVPDIPTKAFQFGRKPQEWIHEALHMLPVLEASLEGDRVMVKGRMKLYKILNPTPQSWSAVAASDSAGFFWPFESAAMAGCWQGMAALILSKHPSSKFTGPAASRTSCSLKWLPLLTILTKEGVTITLSFNQWKATIIIWSKPCLLTCASRTFRAPPRSSHVHAPSPSTQWCRHTFKGQGYVTPDDPQRQDTSYDIYIYALSMPYICHI